jgi:hypothetical protein
MVLRLTLEAIRENNVKLKVGLLFLVSMLLVSCGNPLPEDKLTYVGDWHSKEMDLLILSDGTVAYKRLKNGGSTSINGPIRKFEGSNFVVGVWFFKTTFEVSEPPIETNGNWHMIVDGVRLTKASE